MPSALIISPGQFAGRGLKHQPAVFRQARRPHIARSIRRAWIETDVEQPDTPLARDIARSIRRAWIETTSACSLATVASIYRPVNSPGVD